MHSLRQDRMALVMDATRDIPPAETVKAMGNLEQFKRAFTDYWLSVGFDAVISPAGCLPAVPHKLTSELPTLNSHFLVYNILDFPAGVLPVRLVQAEDIKEDKAPRTTSKDRMSEFMRLA